MSSSKTCSEDCGRNVGMGIDTTQQCLYNWSDSFLGWLAFLPIFLKDLRRAAAKSRSIDFQAKMLLSFPHFTLHRQPIAASKSSPSPRQIKKSPSIPVSGQKSSQRENRPAHRHRQIPHMAELAGDSKRTTPSVLFRPNERETPRSCDGRGRGEIWSRRTLGR